MKEMVFRMQIWSSLDLKPRHGALPILPNFYKRLGIRDSACIRLCRLAGKVQERRMTTTRDRVFFDHKFLRDVGDLSWWCDGDHTWMNGGMLLICKTK